MNYISGPKPALLPRCFDLRTISSSCIDPKKVSEVFQMMIPKSFQQQYFGCAPQNYTRCILSPVAKTKPHQLYDSYLRQAIAWTLMYFCYADNCIMQEDPKLFSIIKNNSNESYIFLGHLAGMRRHTEIHYEGICADFAFQNTEFQQSSKKLMGSVEAVFSLLSTQYEPTIVPQAQQIVVYHDQDQVQHYGIIQKINPNGELVIQSKFGEMYVYTHPLEGVLPYYGDNITFLRRR